MSGIENSVDLEPIWRLWRTGNALASAEIRTKILRSSRSSPSHYTDGAIPVATMINISISYKGVAGSNLAGLRF
jgi:hypothetical protein